jgi:hypothetical protein
MPANLAHPRVEVRLKGGPACELTAGNGVLLDVAYATLVLVLGACPIRCTGSRPKLPMPGEGMQPGIELDLSCCAVVPDYQPAVVEL